MKTNFLKTLTVLLLLMASSIALCSAETKELILIKAPVILVDEDPNEHRMPARPIQCSISEDGIFIQGYDASEILSYEVYDLDGGCLLMTDDPQEFIPLAMNSTSIEVRLITANYVLRGILD